MAPVGADAASAVRRTARSPGERPAARAPRSRPATSCDPVEDAPSRTRIRSGTRTAKTRTPSRRAAAGRRIEQHPDPVSAACRRSHDLVARAAARRAGRPAPQGPGCSTRRKARTVGRGAGELVPLEPGGARCSGSLGSPARGDPRGGGGDRGPGRSAARRAARLGVRPGRGRELVERRAEPGRDVEGAVAEHHRSSRSPRSRRTHGDAGTAAQRSVARRGRARPRPETSPRRSRDGRVGQEPSAGRGGDRGRRRGRRTSSARVVEPRRPARRPGPRDARGSAGGEVLGRQRAERAARRACRTRSAQVRWLIPRVTCRLAASCARAACGVPVGRYMTDAGTHEHLVDPAVGVDGAGRSPSGGGSPRAWCRAVWKTKTSWRVRVHGEALGARRGEIGVDLAGMTELELELGDEARERRPVAVQRLEDDGGAVVERGRRSLARVDEPGDAACPRPWRRCGRTDSGQDVAVTGDPDGGRADRGLGEQVVDVVEREQAGQLVGRGLVQEHAGRPDLVDEGLGVPAEQLER